MQENSIGTSTAIATPTAEPLELDLTYDDAERFQTADGIELYYEVRGKGTPITFLNHVFMVGPAWRAMTRQLEREFELVTYDLRNQGASTRVKSTIAWSEHVEDLRALLDHLEIESTYLVGTSISTLICRDFALQYPERVRGLVLIGPAFSPYGNRRRRQMARTWLTALDSNGVEGLFNYLYPLVFSDYAQEFGAGPMFLGLRDAFVAFHSTEQIRFSLAGAEDVDDDPAKLSALRCPTLLMVGDSDFLWSQSGVEATAKLLRKPTVVTLYRAGHMPYYEDPEGFQRAVGDFVRASEAEGAEGARS